MVVKRLIVHTTRTDLTQADDESWNKRSKKSPVDTGIVASHDKRQAVLNSNSLIFVLEDNFDRFSQYWSTSS